MPNRILKDSICTSDSVNALSDKAEILFYRLIVQCDDHGLFDGRASIIRTKCFPLKVDQIKEKDIEKWLNELTDAGMVGFYTVSGKQYLRMVSWDAHQQVRATHSKYPLPISDDINGYQVISDALENQNRIESESESNQNRSSDDAFELFWSAYPKKVGKQAALRAWKKAKANPGLVDKMLVAIEQQRRSKQWTDKGGQYIPNPATWLNEGRWDDELPTVQTEAERILGL